MATVHPLRGVRYDGRRVDLGRVLAPPYDVVTPADVEALYARDPYNVVRLDVGRPEPEDRPGEVDRYTRAAALLRAWLAEGILRRDPEPAVYLHDHTFPTGTDRRRRRGLFVRVAARPWEESELRPHERTLRAPKEDRLALLRATATHTSPVFALWDQAPGLDDVLAEIATAVPAARGCVATAEGPEEHSLWVADTPSVVAAVTEALAPARLYVADGHHRYETAAAYAAERRAADPAAPADADFALALVYLCAADDPALVVLATHRLVRPGPTVPESLGALAERLGGEAVVVPAATVDAALAAARELRDRRHAFAVVARDQVALLHLPRAEVASPRLRLDVTVLEEAVLRRACGLDPQAIAAGALDYTRSSAEAVAAVRRGAAALAFCLLDTTPREILAVADAGETMPQKSTYFHPKVPTGLVLSPA